MATKKKSSPKWTVDGYDSFDNTSFPCGSFTTLEAAKEKAKATGEAMTIVYVRDHTGKVVAQYGSL